MVKALNKIGELFNILIERNVVVNDEKVINFYYSPKNYGDVICKTISTSQKFGFLAENLFLLIQKKNHEQICSKSLQLTQAHEFYRHFLVFNIFSSLFSTMLQK